ncbi:hypothetical protein [Cohnella luojiensis]|uniref:Uncharacterized protein n=1 Tax=Cohnella luojiensis TaxID=652876 RepID=A0A4Y8LNG8_9BACL|nr:hypothetical protein [Cohnella luojiensis]TFE19822.1 hypothetical protein E2980_21960 [Cohnella luojiensis]
MNTETLYDIGPKLLRVKVFFGEQSRLPPGIREGLEVIQFSRDLGTAWMAIKAKKYKDIKEIKENEIK